MIFNLHKKKTTQLLYVLAIPLLPALFTFLWLVSNTQLPGSDATDFIGAAFKTYEHIVNQQLFTFNFHGVVTRGFRPILFPFLLLPFLIVSSGNVYFAYAATALFCLLASVWYTYLLCRLELNRVAAFIIANIIGLLTFVQAPILTFFAESALFPCLIGSIYHLIASNYFQNKKHTLGFIICMTLAIVMRPIEAVSHSILFIGCFLFFGYKEHFFSGRQIAWVFLTCWFTLFIFCLLIATHFIDHYPAIYIDPAADVKLAKAIYRILFISIAVLPIVAISVAMTSSYQPFKSSLCPPFALICLFPFLWLAPYAFQTFLWIYRTSFGDIAIADSITRPAILSIQLLHKWLLQVGAFVSLGALLLFTLAFLLSPRKNTQILSSKVCVFLLLLTPLPLWEAFFTIQNTPRKLSVVIPAILIVLLIVGLQQTLFWRTRMVMGCSLVIWQFLCALSAIYPNPFFTQKLQGWTGNYPFMNTETPNAHDIVLHFLAKNAEQFRLKKIAIEADINKALPIDTHLLHLMAEINKDHFAVTYPYFSQYTVESPQTLTQTVDAIFLTDKYSDMNISHAAATAYLQKYNQENNPTLKTRYQLLHYFSQNKLAELGWTRGPCMLVQGANQEDYMGCLLLKKKN